MKTISEWDLFKCGSEECYYDLVIANTTTDVENILKLMLFHHSYLTTESNKNKLAEIANNPAIFKIDFFIQKPTNNILYIFLLTIYNKNVIIIKIVYRDFL